MWSISLVTLHPGIYALNALFEKTEDSIKELYNVITAHATSGGKTQQNR